MKNAILGAISLAILAPLGPGAQAQTTPVVIAPMAIPQANHPIRVIIRMAVVAPKEYKVRPGDTLSGIAGKLYGNPDKWPYLYGANRSVVGSNPNVILPGQEIRETLSSKPEYGAAVAAVQRARQVSARYKAAAASRTGKVWGVTYGYPNYCGDGDGDGWDVNCQSSQATSAPQQVTTNTYSASSGGWPGGAFGNCVIQRESGGNSQVMNSSGHYGLYQFSSSTWAAYGGNPATFGHASVAEQESIFMNALAQGGQSNWSTYDGC